MDLATLIGLLAAIGIIAASIFLGGSAGTFFNVPSLLVVVGGTIGAVLMQFSIGQFFGAEQVVINLISANPLRHGSTVDIRNLVFDPVFFENFLISLIERIKDA